MATGAAPFGPAVWRWTLCKRRAHLRTRRPEYLRWAELAHGYATPTALNALCRPGTRTGLVTSTDPRRRQEARALQLEALALADDSMMPRPCSGQRSACC